MPLGQGKKCHSGMVKMPFGQVKKRHSGKLSKFCTSKVGTLQFLSLPLFKGGEVSKVFNFNCKVSFCRWAFFKKFCGLESGRVNLKKQTLAFKLTLSATGLPQILEPVSLTPLV
jgi:hypothetical protein